MKKSTIAILGATGRMGKLLMTAALADPTWVATPLGRADDTRAALRTVDIAIDFTTPSASVQHAQIAAELQKPLVIGTTGLDAAQMQILREASKRTAIVYARNFSLGIHVLRQLVTRAARDLPPEYQIEIVEAHHTHKKDAPSGTGLALAEAAMRAGVTPPIHALRLGGIIGDHAVHFANAQEVITLEHRAIDRAVFAIGALRAARWLITQPPGFYGMDDLIQA
jgi:4-hydroxy-tetrahydrodipicolinate reductase